MAGRPPRAQVAVPGRTPPRIGTGRGDSTACGRGIRTAIRSDGRTTCRLTRCGRAHPCRIFRYVGSEHIRAANRDAASVSDHQHRLLDARPRPRAARHRRSGVGCHRLPRLLHLPGRAGRLARPAVGLRSVRGAGRSPAVRARRGPGRVGGRAQPARLPDRGRPHRPARQDRAGGRRGAVSVDRGGAAAQQGGRRRRGDLAARRGAARVHRGRLRLPRPRGEPGGGRDRERPPVRAHPPPAGAGRGHGRPRPRRLGRLDARPAPAGRGAQGAAAARGGGLRGVRLERRRHARAGRRGAGRGAARPAADGLRPGRGAGPRPRRRRRLEAARRAALGRSPPPRRWSRRWWRRTSSWGS